MVRGGAPVARLAAHELAFFAVLDGEREPRALRSQDRRDATGRDTAARDRRSARKDSVTRARSGKRATESTGKESSRFRALWPVLAGPLTASSLVSVTVEPVIAASARKHGVSDEDIMHAYGDPIRVFELDEGFTMLVGGSAAAELFEIGVVEATTGLVVVHAMPARKAFMR